MSTKEQGKPASVERVRVNQRGLIDKILARYPSPHAVFRELLQNADDAKAENVYIHFETDAKVPSGKLVRCSIRNDGNSFTSEDWKRLKVIAAGNPGTDTIGAFGVGFYSVFSISDRPFMRSGAEKCEFSWRDNELYVSQWEGLKDENTCTTVELPLLPGRHDHLPGKPFEHFIATSLPFMKHIKSISLEHNSSLLFSFQKAVEPSCDVPLLGESTPVGYSDFETTVLKLEEGRLRIKNDKSQIWSAHIGSETRTILEQGALLWSASVGIKKEKTSSRIELEKMIKKAIPDEFNIQIASLWDVDCEETLTMSGEATHYNACLNQNGDPHQGYVFIGHATSQTTGFLGNISGHFIPTMEREMLDLENKHVEGWNKQLLYTTGRLARTIYDRKMESISSRYQPATPVLHSLSTTPDFDLLCKQFKNILHFFTFKPSTPNPAISTIIQDAFYGCTTGHIHLLTPNGIFPANRVRSHNDICSRFLNIPMVEALICPMVKDMLGHRASSVLKDVGFDDVIKELETRLLSEKEMVACLEWFIGERSDSEQQRKVFLEAARFKSSDDTIHLAEIISIVDHKKCPFISSAFSLPRTTLPFCISSQISDFDSLLSLFGASLSIEDWLTYLCDNEYTNPTQDGASIQLLTALSNAWQDFPGADQLTISQVLRRYKCILTRHGMQRPDEAYLSDRIALAFPTLPVVVLLQWGLSHGPDTTMETFLLGIGVNSRIKPEILSSISGLNNRSLVRYLMEHRPTELEKEDLSNLPLFTQAGNDQRRYRAKELHVPNIGLESLGLPILSWEEGSQWEDRSPEAHLLSDIGLQRYPDIIALLQVAESSPQHVRLVWDVLRRDFSNHYESALRNEENKKLISNIRFIPVEGQNDLFTISKVFVQSQSSILGFHQLRSGNDFKFATQLGVLEHPLPSELLLQLKAHPPTGDTAQKCFEYLFHQPVLDNDITSNGLANSDFVPVSINGQWKNIKPTQCYIGTDHPHFYKEMFHFVDFGNSGNSFLERCGTKKIPGPEEVASRLFENPSVCFNGSDESQEKYLEELRKIAKLDRKELETLPRNNAVLLGCLPSAIDTERPTFIDRLLRPSEVMIMDDELASFAFCSIENLFYAPKDLEDLYDTLGCKHLSKCSSVEYSPKAMLPNDEHCSALRAKVLERLRILVPTKDKSRRERLANMSELSVFRVMRCKSIDVKTTLSRLDKIVLETQANAGYVKVPGPQPQWQLWFTDPDSIDYFQIASCVLKNLYNRPTINMCYLLMSLLSETPENLRKRGYQLGQPEESAKPHKTKPPSQPVNADTPINNISLKYFPSVGQKSSGNGVGGAGNNAPASPENLDEMLKRAVSSFDNAPRGDAISIGSLKPDGSAGKPYCDGHNYVGSLRRVDFGEKLLYNVWSNQGTPELPLVRSFINDVIEPLRQIYDFPDGRIQILWDPSHDELAAFYRFTLIYLNLYHYKQRPQKSPSDVLIAWYHFLSHEMAHMFFPSHDANFEWLCSNLRQHYLLKLFGLLQSKQVVEADVDPGSMNGVQASDLESTSALHVPKSPSSFRSKLLFWR